MTYQTQDVDMATRDRPDENEGVRSARQGGTAIEITPQMVARCEAALLDLSDSPSLASMAEYVLRAALDASP